MHELLNDNNLDNYYKLARKSGIKPKSFDKSEFAFLDDKGIQEKLLQFSINGRAKITLFIPEVYCSACIWLLENLNRLDKGILESTVNFLKKEITIAYNEELTSLRKIVELITSIGYKPRLNISDIEGKKKVGIDKSIFLKVGVAGFAFGNVMLFAFPDYLSGGVLEPEFKKYFGYLSLLLGGALMYSASDFFKTAWTSLKLGYISIDLPISLGILALLVRSIIDILSGTGPGFIDSMAGLVFLLLVGRIFRQKTFYSLSFDRDYKSYFPLSVIRKKNGIEQFVSLNEIKPEDNLIIRNNEIVPTDSILESDSAMIDYSFVSGESKPVDVAKGQKIYAGGIHEGRSIEVKAVKAFHQSYITELWNHKAFAKGDDSYSSKISNTAAMWFTIAIIVLATGSFLYWMPKNINIAFNAMTSVLIIACPCAFALVLPYTYGTVLRVFSRNSFFLKNANIVESMAKIDNIIFDKTGTLTDISKSRVEYAGRGLKPDEEILIKSTAKHSTHPLSRLVFLFHKDTDNVEIINFSETPGKGIEAEYDGTSIRLGKLEFVRNPLTDCSVLNEIEFEQQRTESSVYLAIDNVLMGYYIVKPSYRSNIKETIEQLIRNYQITILSGDNDAEKENLNQLTGGKSVINFNQLPIDKLEHIEKLQAENNKVMMIGDGLNDAGAIRQSNVGIAVTNSDSSFTPGSDAIMQADKIDKLPAFIDLTNKAVKTVYLSFAISILYNLVGLFFAVQGNLTPLISAVYMPVSSFTIMGFTVLKVRYDAMKLKL